MKYSVFAYHNNRLGCYCSPVFDDHSSDVVKSNVSRSLKYEMMQHPEETVSKFKGMTFEELGTWDDETGKFESIEPIILVNCDSLLQIDSNDDGKVS